MQWVAMLTMLIDHIGVVFFPDQLWLRLIGRIAFPLYAYLIVIGYHRTRSYRNYVIRLSLLAIISQPVYQWAFDTTQLNVIVTLLVGLLLLKVLDMTAKSVPLQVIIAIAVIAISSFVSLDYGAYGIILMLIFRYIRKEQLFLYHAILEIPFLFVWGVQFISLISTYFISYQQQIVQKLDSISVPRWLWRSFYPLHLLILAYINYTF